MSIRQAILTTMKVFFLIVLLLASVEASWRHRGINEGHRLAARHDIRRHPRDFKSGIGAPAHVFPDYDELNQETPRRLGLCTSDYC
ncbi:hypothetical protein QR680_013876 [Steinernema hermaphroditum]|uniref:Uncharacterized protein n=1 Tax=Steinernema hermaphroditum TaxID=289476 RepID=A0AA39I9A6_9BILA|nr:hypothetical protein QR680_013876 [Steinernema hermaphroditum]